MNTNMPPTHTLSANESGETHGAFSPSPETVRVSLIYLALSVAAVLMAAACIAHWRVYFI